MTGVRARLEGSAAAIARTVPEALLLRMLPAGLRWDPTGVEVAVAARTDRALFIGPANSAGQGFRWARAAEEGLDRTSAVSMATIPRGAASPAFPVDVAVPLSATILSRRWREAQRRALRSGFTHAIFESGRIPYGGGDARPSTAAMRELAASGVSVAFLWHGSDIRLPSAHAREEPDSPFGPNGAYDPGQTTRLERNAASHRRMVAVSDFPVFVSTPGLLDVPRAVWLPVVVDAAAWATDAAPLSSARPVVAYAPSNSPMKGDPSIDAQLRALDERGLIVYRRVEGIPHGEMPDLYRSADIVIDQFRLGDYGVAACEAMAAGRVVVGHVSEAVRTHIHRATGRELPIVESRFAAVAATVEGILADRDEARRTAAAGPGFVAELHDGRASARALAGFLGVTAPSAPHVQEERP